MQWIGITGDLGAGKSSVANIIRQVGYLVLDADKVVHDLYAQDLDLAKDLANVLGEEILVNSHIDRQKLKDKILQDETKLPLVEKIVHPYVREYVEAWKNEHLHQDLLFYEIPLLFENELDAHFDAIVYVTADEEIAAQRLQERNAWKQEEIQQRRKWLLDTSLKEGRSDYVIRNDGDLNHLENKVLALLNELTKNYKSRKN
tara:strand:- start:1866 stop:2471 length:606 start_codon:yes stop_codon:yes gene_type:complete